MDISEPISFREAVQFLLEKKLLPTDMTSAELMQLGADIRERALFSARTLSDYYLARIKDLILRTANGEMDAATARLELKTVLGEIGYSPAPDERGGIKDLAGDSRINLVVRTNTEMAQGFGQWRQGQDEGALDAFPAQELYRLEARKVPRDWLDRWKEKGGPKLVGGGRMIARKDDPIWTAISAFGQPYPPFDFNSGMWTRDVSYKEAVALGVMTPGEKVAPQRRGFEMQ